MTHRRLTVVLALVLALAAPSAARADWKTREAGQRFVPGEALVTYEHGVGADERRDLRGAADVDFEASLELPQAQVVSFDGPVRDAIARLEDEPGVADAQPNYLYHALAAAPNDSHFGELWGLAATPGVNVLPAWDRTQGAGQVIAIVDTGVDLTHPDLAGNLWSMPGQPGVHGHDFVDGDDNPDDFNLHGTHVAATAAGIAGNGQGVAGVAPQARVMAVRVLDGDGGGTSSQIASGIAFAANNGAGVINLSLGGPAGDGDEAMREAVALAEQRGAVVVAAAGNEGTDNDASPTTPCTLRNANLICVASVTRTGARSDFSNYGSTTVDVGAPGGDGSGTPAGDILSAKPSWGAPLFSESFNAGAGNWTATHTGGVDWGIESGAGLGGSNAAADSPGGNYLPNTSSQLQKTTGVDLSGRRGCRIDYFVGLSGIQSGTDFVGVGVLSGAEGIGLDMSGDSGGFYERVETSISGFDGRTDVRPTLRFSSDGAISGDGAYVDNFSLVCRGQSDNDLVAADDSLAGGSYTALAGTSMAAPHVAGVAALVRAVDPGAPASQVVQAIRKGAKPVPGLSGVTSTGGTVDAAGAIDAALALPNPQPPAARPAKPRVLRVSVSRRGVVTMVVKGSRATNGKVTLRARVLAARLRIVARRSFRIGSTGRARVRLRLSRPALRQLRRTRRLRLRAKVVTRNAAGLSSGTSATIRLSLRRR